MWTVLFHELFLQLVEAIGMPPTSSNASVPWRGCDHCKDCQAAGVRPCHPCPAALSLSQIAIRSEDLRYLTL